MSNPLAPMPPALPAAAPSLAPPGLAAHAGMACATVPLMLTELRLLVQRAEQSLRLYALADASHEDMEDHRTGVLADLLDVLDGVEPGLGTRLMHAMYPRTRASWGTERRRQA